MSRCINADNSNCCFWADYDQDTGDHVEVEEPDYLLQKNPRGVAPMRRVMQKCGQGRNEWRIGQYATHNCPLFEDFKARKERSEKLKKSISESKRQTFQCRTERIGIPDKSDMFYFLTQMIEDSKVAYDWLMDIYATFGDIDPAMVLGFFARLNDMNIRGRQIDVIVNEWFVGYPHLGKGKTFTELFNHLVDEMNHQPNRFVALINEGFDKSDVEQAVPEGASIFAHKPLG